MDRSERIARLKAMLQQVAPENQVEAIAAKYEKPPGGLESMESPEAVPVRRGLEKVMGDRDDLSPPELDGLEAIVMPRERPVVFVRRSGIDALPDPWAHLNKDPLRQSLLALAPSIGRVELPNSTQYPYGGTGFVVGPDLLMTNRHVAGLFAIGLGFRDIRYVAGDAAVNFDRFKREEGDPPEDQAAALQVREVLMIHPYWDMALLRVDGLTSAHTPLTLSTRDPGQFLDAEVAVMGYPARDDRNDLPLQDRIFAHVYYVKRLQPGKVRRRDTCRSFGHDVSALTHDSSTLGGNSGSAVIDLKTGQVVGLHFAGEYLKANYAVPAYELARDSRVVDQGVNFAGSLPATTVWATYWQDLDREVKRAAATADAGKLIQSSPARAASAPRAPDAGNVTQATITGGSMTVTWTIPLSVTVSLGAPTIAGAEAGADGAATTGTAAAAEEALRAPIIYDGLESRGGYDPEFLELDEGLTVPLPQLTASGKKAVATLEDGSSELKYHKFSVVVHKRRRLALFTAANVDWRPDSRLIDGTKPSRKLLTGLENDQELWVTDPRIPEAHQLPDVFYTKDERAFDKGHLVRREDVCWGTSFEDIQMANGDTFHTTNCSPQVAEFNRSNKGKDNWGDLENLVQAQTRAEKAILFSGPVLADDDQVFNGRDVHGRVAIMIPRTFWKIVLVKGDEGPEAYGFVLEQDLSAVPRPEEFVITEQWKPFMKSIADIERSLDGLAKLTWLKRYDQFETDSGHRVAESVMSR